MSRNLRRGGILGRWMLEGKPKGKGRGRGNAGLMSMTDDFTG